MFFFGIATISISNIYSSTIWNIGSTYTIQWTSSGFPSGSAVTIQLWQSSPSSLITTISSSTLVSSNSYSWTVPSTISPGTNYYVYIKSATYSNVVSQSSTFAIQGQSSGGGGGGDGTTSSNNSKCSVSSSVINSMCSALQTLVSSQTSNYCSLSSDCLGITCSVNVFGTSYVIEVSLDQCSDKFSVSFTSGGTTTTQTISGSGSVQYKDLKFTTSNYQLTHCNGYDNLTFSASATFSGYIYTIPISIGVPSKTCSQASSSTVMIAGIAAGSAGCIGVAGAAVLFSYKRKKRLINPNQIKNDQGPMSVKSNSVDYSEPVYIPMDPTTSPSPSVITDNVPTYSPQVSVDVPEVIP